jgi:type IV pilus secretin PilQ/predicted competence protein
MNRLLYILLLALHGAGCAASQAQPEIVGVDYETRVSGDGVLESGFDDQSDRSAEALADVRAVAAELEALRAPAVFAEEPEVRVLEVLRAADSEGLRLVVQLSRVPGRVAPAALDDPPRCMVDVYAPTAENFGPPRISTGDPRVPQIRIGNHADHLRLVVDRRDDSVACAVEADGSAIVFAVGKAPVSAPAGGLWRAGDDPVGAHAHAVQTLARASGKGSAPAALAPEERVASRRQAGPGAGRGEARPETAYPPRAPADPESIWRTGIGDDPGAAPRRKIYTGRRISLEFKDADILNVLRIIADVARRNIVATDDVSGRVTIVLYDVPWDQALDILLKSTGLEMVEFDDVITISTARRLEEERKARLAAQVAGRELEALQTAYLKVNYVKARELAGLLQGASTTSSAGALAAVGMGGEDSAGRRRGLLSYRGSVMVNDATNTLIVRDIADGVANARELVRRLDVQTPQVAIQGLIFEADTDVGRDLGVRWGASYVASPETGNPTGRNFPGRVAVGGAGPRDAAESETASVPILVDFPAKGVAAGAGSTLGLVLGSLDGSSQIDAQITAIEKAGKGKVISRPKVITLNNAEAQIQSLEILRVRLPSTGTVINTGVGGSAGGQTQATQAIDTGIILRVTPQVSSDGYVLMQMFVKSSVPSTAATDGIPNEISRQATSQVLVRDGETVVIGGVYRQQAAQAEGGVPWLKDVPLLGWLFKNTSVGDRRQELLVFITPRVVWRTVLPESLPSAASLWQERDKSAYQIGPSEYGDGVPN